MSWFGTLINDAQNAVTNVENTLGIGQTVPNNNPAQTVYTQNSINPTAQYTTDSQGNVIPVSAHAQSGYGQSGYPQSSGSLTPYTSTTSSIFSNPMVLIGGGAAILLIIFMMSNKGKKK